MLRAPEQAIVWPKPPDAPRVRYIGALTSSEDLHPAKSFGEVLDELISGPIPPSPLVKPHAVAVHSGGERVAVADTDAACVHVFDLAARHYTRIESSGSSSQRLECPTGVGWDGDTLWIADARLHTAIMIAPNGAGRLVGIDALKRPAGLVCCPADGLTYISDAGSHAVLAFNRQGEFVRQFGTQGGEPGQFNFPAQIACGSDGTLVVADAMNFRVQRLRPDGTPINAFGQKGDATGDFGLPKGVAVDAHGNIWVVDANFENVQAFSPEGQLLMVLGSEGHDPGEFWLPAGAFIDARQRMWIADTYNRRVQVFELLP